MNAGEYVESRDRSIRNCMWPNSSHVKPVTAVHGLPMLDSTVAARQGLSRPQKRVLYSPVLSSPMRSINSRVFPLTFYFDLDKADHYQVLTVPRGHEAKICPNLAVLEAVVQKTRGS